ncbi:MAG: DUF86 domain-containing protein [Opitutaceae bacterium]|nr:DUF86 domain-containing protein [Opitutaceae bacterium]
MPRNPTDRLHDIIEACEAIARYIDGLDSARFATDEKTRDAVVRRFEIVGEAVKALPPEWTAREPGIPWRQITGFRDVLAHAYFAVEVSVVWDAAARKAPELRLACLRLLV